MICKKAVSKGWCKGVGSYESDQMKMHFQHFIAKFDIFQEISILHNAVESLNKWSSMFPFCVIHFYIIVDMFDRLHVEHHC